MLSNLKGDGTWPFTVQRDGFDLVVRGHNATWFGGANDPSDNGLTASGISTRANPLLLGYALPMDIGPGFQPTTGSPFFRLPWGIVARIWAPETNKTIHAHLIDLGPAKWACQKNDVAIDLTQAAFEALGFKTSKGVIRVDYRIIDGTKYL